MILFVSGKIGHGDYNNGQNGGYDYYSWSYEQGYEFYYPTDSGKVPTGWKFLHENTKKKAYY